MLLSSEKDAAQERALAQAASEVARVQELETLLQVRMCQLVPRHLLHPTS